MPLAEFSSIFFPCCFFASILGIAKENCIGKVKFRKIILLYTGMGCKPYALQYFASSDTKPNTAYCLGYCHEKKAASSKDL